MMMRLYTHCLRTSGLLRHCRLASKFGERDMCRYEMILDKFKKEQQPAIQSEYLLFLQEMRQYFFRGAYDLYNTGFLKFMLRNSLKRDPEYQLYSIVYFRKKRRHTDYETVEEYYREVKDFMEDFYTLRNDEIRDTFKDLSLEYELAAKVIFESLGDDDFEMQGLVHDSRPYSYMLPQISRSVGYDSSIDRQSLADMKDVIRISMTELRSHTMLEIDHDHFIEANHWTIFQANILTVYDKIYKQTGLEEEDLKRDQSTKEMLESEEKKIWNSIKLEIERLNSRVLQIAQEEVLMLEDTSGNDEGGREGEEGVVIHESTVVEEGVIIEGITIEDSVDHEEGKSSSEDD